LDLKLAKENPFLDLVNHHPIACTDYLDCIQCGRCVGSCPAAMVSPRFNMRVMNKRIADGDMSLLADDTIWDCFYCSTCTGLCPRNSIDPYKTILILRDVALSRGFGVSYLKNLLPLTRWFLDKGVVTPGGSWMDEDAIDEIKAIASETGMDGLYEALASKFAKGKFLPGDAP
jgi:heterodisulfide reductase subunit C